MSRRDYYDDDDSRIIIERHHSAGVGSFLLGVAIGAGIALLVAPRSGAATRRDIKRRAMRVKRAAETAATDVTDSVVGTFQEARRKVEDQIDSVRQAVDLKRQQVHRAMDAGRAAAREAREELEQRIAETKAAYGAGAAVARGPRSPVDLDEE